MLKQWCGIVLHIPICKRKRMEQKRRGGEEHAVAPTTGHGKGMPTASLFESGRLLLLMFFFFFHITPKNRALASSYHSLDGGGSRLRAERRPPQQRDGATFGRDIARKPLFLLVLLRSAFLFACLRGTRRTSRECCAASRRLGFPISRGGLAPWLPPSFVDCFFLYLHVCARHFLLRD